MGTDFRQVLKDRTQADHDRVDQALSAFNVATRQGLQSFLCVHHICFSQMLQQDTAEAGASSGLADMISAIDLDLRALGVAPPLSSVGVQGAFDGLACAYLVEGSRLGSKVLARRWAGSEDRSVLAAKAYFTLPPVQGRWRAVCDQLSEVDPDSLRAATILRDTKALFDLFFRAAQEAAPDPLPEKALSS